MKKIIIRNVAVLFSIGLVSIMFVQFILVSWWYLIPLLLCVLLLDSSHGMLSYRMKKLSPEKVMPFVIVYASTLLVSLASCYYEYYLVKNPNYLRSSVVFIIVIFSALVLIFSLRYLILLSKIMKSSDN